MAGKLGPDRGGDEDEYRREKRPEETLLAVTVGVVLVGGIVAETQTDGQELLIDRVGEASASITVLAVIMPTASLLAVIPTFAASAV